MTVYSFCFENGDIFQVGARKDENPIMGADVPIDEFEKRFPGVIHFIETQCRGLLVRIFEGLFDDELTKICEDVVASHSS